MKMIAHVSRKSSSDSMAIPTRSNRGPKISSHADWPVTIPTTLR